MTAHSVLNVRAAPEWGNSELYKYYERNGLGYGTVQFQRYVDTPIQTLDGIIVNQPKCFLPLAQEARKITEEIRIEKINEQWAGIP